jgi:eukaryotic-like serine/threonine-protein kinase
MNLCPTEADLQGLLTDGLPGDVRTVVERHIEACPACQRQLDVLTQAGELKLATSHSIIDRGPAFLERLQAHYPATLLGSASGQHGALHFPGPPTDVAPLGQVGDFDILAEVGSGSFGWVFRSRERSLDRIVALKILKPEMTARPEAIVRFEREARKASLKHDHIVSVHRFEKPVGFPPYLVMEYVEGETLEAKLKRETRLTPDEAANITRQIALGLAAAHAIGLVHRDIKPANILLESKDEGGRIKDEGTQSQLPDSSFIPPPSSFSRVKISDFGLARDITDESMAVTGAGELAGTAPYMSPEHFRAPEAVDGRSDVFSLGVVLYQLLTGKLPFKGSFLQIRSGILEDEPTAPRRLQDRIPVDLETIALCCLEKDPQRRYATAQAVAEDLRRFQSGEPILCRPTGRVERAVKWIYRKPAQAGLVGLGTLAALAVGVLIVVQIFYAQLQAANASLGKTQDDLLHTNRNLSSEQAAVGRLSYVADMNLAHQAWQSDNFGLLEQYLAAYEQSDLRGFEWHYLRWLAGTDVRRIGPTDPVTAMTFDQSGRFLALAVAGPTGCELQVWTPPSPDKPRGEMLQSMGIPHENIKDIAFHPTNTDWLFTSDRAGYIGLWDLKKKEKINTIAGNGPFALSPNGQSLAYVRLDGRIQRWSLSTRGDIGAPFTFADIKPPESSAGIRVPPGSKPGDPDKGRFVGSEKPGKPVGRGPKEASSGVEQLAFSHDGQRLAAVGGHYGVGGVLAVWDIKSGNRIDVKEARHDDLVTSVAFSADSIAAVGYDHALRVWDAKAGTLRFRRFAHKLEVLSVAFNAKGDRLTTAGWDQTVKIWNARTGEEVGNLRGSRGIVVQVLFAPVANASDQEHIVSRNEFGELRWYDADEEQAARVVRLNEPAQAVAFSRTGRYLAALGRNVQVLVQDLVKPEVRYDLTAPTAGPRGLFSEDETTLFMGGADGAVKSWRFAADKHTALVRNSATLTSKRLLARSDDDHWSISPALAPLGKLTPFGPVPTHDVSALAVDDAGALLAFANADRTGIVVRRQDTLTEKTLPFPTTANRTVTALAFSPDGHYLAVAAGNRANTGERDNAIFLFDVRAGALRHHLTGHLCFVSCLAFSPDGKRLASGSEDWTVKIWDIECGRATLTLGGHTGRIRDLAFSPDGSWLASADEDATVRLWPTVRNDAAKRWPEREQPSKLIRGQ